MSREKEIELLMKDGCTKAEAERHLASGSAVIEDFEEHFNDYMVIVEDGGKIYYIMYAL